MSDIAISASQTIETYAGHHQDASKKKDQAGMVAAAREILRLVTRIELEHPVPADMSTFFASVADGVTTAQQHLDALSGEYLDDRPAHAIPTGFRIQRAEAELSFELSSVTSKRVGVLFHRRTESTTEEIEHRVSFEIQALPPPPEVQAEVVGQPLVFSFEPRGPSPLRNRIGAALSRRIARDTAIMEDPDESDTARKHAWARRDKLEVVRGSRDEAWIVRRPDGYVIIADHPTAPHSRIMVAAHAEGEELRIEVTDDKTERVPLVLRRLLDALFEGDEESATSGKGDPDKRVAAVKSAAIAARNKAFDRPSVQHLLEAATDLEALYPPVADEDEAPISSFVTGVGRAFVDAQRDLDRRSAQYLNNDPLVPTTFRIPSVKADLSFAVEATRGNKLNAIIYAQEQRESRRREQRVRFELGAAPLSPAELAARSRGTPRRWVIVTAAPERARVRAALRRGPLPGEGEVSDADLERREKCRQLAADGTFEALTIVRTPQGYVVLEATGDSTVSIDAVYLSRSLDPAETWTTTRRGSKIPRSYQWLFDWWLPTLAE